jgi:2-methylcitrate dehydratase PrpD
VTVHPSLLDVCGIPQPQTGLEAKFSLTGTTAMALLGMDTTDPTTFVDALVQGEALQRLIRRVRIETDRNLRQTQAVVEFEDKAQRLFRAEHDSGVPASDLAAQGARLHDKFLSVAGIALGDGAGMFEQKLQTLPGVDDVRSVLS